METDFEKMLQLMQLMGMFTESPQPVAPGPMAQGAPFLFYDRGIPGTKTPDASMPFNYQRAMGTLGKLLELQQLMEMYGSQVPGGDPTEWRCRLLAAIRPFTAENKRYMIDLLLKLMEIKQIMAYADGYRPTLRK